MPRADLPPRLPAHCSPVLITGASGSLGSTLARHLVPRVGELIASHHRHPVSVPGVTPLPLDLRDSEALGREIRRARPAVVLHAAAATDADWCEEHPREAWEVNVRATADLARLASEVGARIIFFSTDLVFDGSSPPYTEESIPRPLSHYGRSKLGAEEEVRRQGGAFLILRLALLFGRGSPSRGTFFDSLVRRLSEGDQVTLFADQYRTPVYLADVARLAAQGMARSAGGLYHVAGSERLSRFEFGLSVCRAFGFSERLLARGSWREHPFRAVRPGDCSLVNRKVSRELEVEFTAAAAALAELAEGWSPPPGRTRAGDGSH